MLQWSSFSAGVVCQHNNPNPDHYEDVTQIETSVCISTMDFPRIVCFVHDPDYDFCLREQLCEGKSVFNTSN